jgi:hypothetical protein
MRKRKNDKEVFGKEKISINQNWQTVRAQIFYHHDLNISILLMIFSKAILPGFF